MRRFKLPRISWILWALPALLVAGPAAAHDPGGFSSQQDGNPATWTWIASAALSSPNDQADFPNGPVNVNVNGSSQFVKVTGPGAAGFSVVFRIWVENDQTQLGNALASTPSQVENLTNGMWEQAGNLSRVATDVAVDSHTASAWAEIVIGTYFNYALAQHTHDYTVSN